MLFLWGDMMKVKLGDVCEIVSGTTPKSNCSEYWNGELNWITPAELNDDIVVVNESQRKITTKAVIDSNLRPFPAGTVLLSSRAPIGKVAIAGKEMYCNQGFKNLICSDFIYNKYLFYFLKSKVAYLNSLGRGATFKEISKTIVENIQINLPKKEEQYKIVYILDKISEIISLCQQQLKKIDELVKSRFIEMFGDPVTNSKMWKIDCLGNITTKIGSGMTPRGGKESYLATGVALIRSMNVHDGKFEYKDLAYISAKQASEMKNVELIENDVLFNITGASVTRTCVVPNTILPARVNQHVAIIRCINESLNPIFLNNLFLQDGFKYKLLNLARAGGATREAITKQQLEDLNVILPPIEIQNQFADFVEQTDKSKLEIQKSLDKLEILKKSLMQKYFG